MRHSQGNPGHGDAQAPKVLPRLLTVSGVAAGLCHRWKWRRRQRHRPSEAPPSRSIMIYKHRRHDQLHWMQI